MTYYFIVNNYVGNCLLFWAKDSCGYTCDVAKAQLYSEEEAMKTMRLGECAIPFEDVMAGVRTMADGQYVSRKNQIRRTS